MVESGSLHASCLAPWLKSSLYTLRYGAPIPSASYAAPPPPCNSPYIVNNFLRGILFLINEESGLPLYFLLHSASSFLTSFTLFPSIVNHLRIGRCSPFLLYFFLLSFVFIFHYARGFFFIPFLWSALVTGQSPIRNRKSWSCLFFFVWVVCVNCIQFLSVARCRDFVNGMKWSMYR